MNKSSWWKTVAKYAVGAVLLGYVVYANWEPNPDVPGSGLKAALDRPIRLGPFLLAGLLCAVNVFQTFVRWFLLVRAQGLPFTLRGAVRLGLVGYFFNTFLPGSVGGDLIKAAGIAREQERQTVAVATVLIDRAIGLAALVWLVALAGGVYWLRGDPVLNDVPELRTVVRTAIWVAVGTLAGWLVLGLLPDRRADRFASRLKSIPKVGRMFAEMWRAVWMYRRRSGTVAVAMVMSLFGHTCSTLMFYCAASTFQPADDPTAMPPLGTHFLITPVGMAAQAFFPAPGGIGGGEFVFGRLYRLVGYPEANGILGSLGQRVWTWVLGAAGYVAYLLMKRDRDVPVIRPAPAPTGEPPDPPAGTSSGPPA